MADHTTWTHVYVAKMPTCVKIGVSKNPEQRMKDLAGNYGFPRSDVTLIKAWRVDHAHRVEFFAKRILWKHPKLGWERFVIEPEIAVTAIEQAIATVASGDHRSTHIDRRNRRAERLARYRKWADDAFKELGE